MRRRRRIMRIEIKKEYNEVHEKRLMLFRVFLFSPPFTPFTCSHPRCELEAPRWRSAPPPLRFRGSETCKRGTWDKCIGINYYISKLCDNTCTESSVNSIYFLLSNFYFINLPVAVKLDHPKGVVAFRSRAKHLS